jgi:UDP-glucuronate 4-epimerase
MRVLVTGAAGFIGSRLVEVLLEGGYRVLGFDMLDKEESQAWKRDRLASVSEHEKFSFVKGDVNDAGSLHDVFADFKPEAVVHLASRRDLNFCETHPIFCHRLHVEGAIQVMRACLRVNVSHLVLASSSHVYGGSRKFPFKENDKADKPLSALGAAMRSMELAAHAFSLRAPVNISVIRLFSVFGPRQAPTRLVPVLMAAALKRMPLPIIGDGTIGRDMVYVDDVVVGMLRIMDRPTPFRIVNLGSEQTTTLGQVAELISAEADVVMRLEHLSVRPGEMPNTWADISRIRNEVGFSPTVELADGIRRTMRWNA